jgi:hypothetical protein
MIGSSLENQMALLDEVAFGTRQVQSLQLNLHKHKLHD